MDAVTAPLNAALHDDLLRSIQDTGVYGYGMDIGIIEPELPAVSLDVHNSPAIFPQHLPQTTPTAPSPHLQPSARGQQLVAAADSAIAKALQASERTRQSMALCEAASAAADDTETALDATPKQRKKRPPSRGLVTNSAGSDGPQATGGRNNGKGLRHFSMKVCEKVESKGRTTYNEVADELVGEFSGSPGIAAYDEKNIRRRVYDALNVLMAMDIIIKDKKDISWKGLPSAPHAQLEKLKEERAALSQKILNQQVYLQEERTAVQVKILNQQAYLQETSKQHRAYRNLLVRHADKPTSMLSDAARTGTGPTPLKLPFILIQVNPEAAVEIQISDDNRQALFDFASTCFRIIGDEEVLYEMNLHLPPGGSSAAAEGQKLQAPGQSPGLAQVFAGHQTPLGPSLGTMGSGGVLNGAASQSMRTVEQNGHLNGQMSSQKKQASEVSQGDYAMLSQSSQDQTQAMDEGTPPEKALSRGPGGSLASGAGATPPSVANSMPSNAELSPALLPPLTALSSSHPGLLSPTTEMMNASNAWRWPELQKEASMPSHASSTTPTAPSAQMLQQLMQQMQASTQGFAGGYPTGAFPIPSLDAGHPSGQWRQ